VQGHRLSGVEYLVGVLCSVEQLHYNRGDHDDYNDNKYHNQYYYVYNYDHHDYNYYIYDYFDNYHDYHDDYDHYCSCVFVCSGVWSELGD
jgi:hypothetical protein